MCGSMVYIQSAATEIRRGIKKKKIERNNSAKIYCPHLLRRAAIISLTCGSFPGLNLLHMHVFNFTFPMLMFCSVFKLLTVPLRMVAGRVAVCSGRCQLYNRGGWSSCARTRVPVGCR